MFVAGRDCEGVERLGEPRPRRAVAPWTISLAIIGS